MTLACSMCEVGDCVLFKLRGNDVYRLKKIGYALKGLDMTGLTLVEIATLLGRRHVAQWESTTLTR